MARYLETLAQDLVDHDQVDEGLCVSNVVAAAFTLEEYLDATELEIDEGLRDCIDILLKEINREPGDDDDDEVVTIADLLEGAERTTSTGERLVSVSLAGEEE